MGGAAVAGLFLFIKTLRAETQKILPERKTASWTERALHNHRSRQVLALACLASIILFASTNSIYLEVDYARDVKVNIKIGNVSASNKTFWKGKPVLVLSQEEGKLLAGGPVFFKPWPVSLNLSLEKPAGWNLSNTEIFLNPFRSTKLTIDKTLIIRLVPGEALHNRLFEEGRVFQLQVTVGDQQPEVLSDWQTSTVHSGAPKSELEAKGEWGEEWIKCMPKDEYSSGDTIEGHFDIDYLPSTRMALGQSIIVEVFDTTDPNKLLVYFEEFTLEDIGVPDGGVFTKCMTLKD